MYHYSCCDYYWDSILWDHTVKYKTLLRFWVNTDNSIPPPKDPVYILTPTKIKQSKNQVDIQMREHTTRLSVFASSLQKTLFFVCLYFQMSWQNHCEWKRIRGFQLLPFVRFRFKNKEGSRKINFIILRNNHWNSRCEYIHYTMLNAVHQCTSICLPTTSRHYYPLKGQAGEDSRQSPRQRFVALWSSQNSPKCAPEHLAC